MMFQQVAARQQSIMQQSPGGHNASPGGHNASPGGGGGGGGRGGGGRGRGGRGGRGQGRGNNNNPNAMGSLAYGAMNFALPGAGGGGVDPNGYAGTEIQGLPPSATVNAQYAHLYN